MVRVLQELRPFLTLHVCCRLWLFICSGTMATLSQLLPPTSTTSPALIEAGFQDTNHCKKWFKSVGMSHGTVDEMTTTIESWSQECYKKGGKLSLPEIIIAMQQTAVKRLLHGGKSKLVNEGKSTVLHPNTSTCFVLYSACAIYTSPPPPPLPS